MNRSAFAFASAPILTTCALVVACASKTSDPGPGATGTQSTAAAVAGPADSHCAGKPVVVATQAACHPAAADAGADSGGADAGGEPKADYGPTESNSEGEDDDCKYHVKWTSTPVTKGADVTLAIVATNRNNGSPVAGAKPYSEVFLNDTHPGPNTPVKTTETSPGNYTIGPVRFDVSGKWNVRFHFAADCSDGETSPHGHVAFFVNVS